MDILLVAADECTYPKFSYSVRKALESLKHKVSIFNYRKYHLNRLKITNALLNKELLKKSHGRDLVIVIKGESLNPKVIKQISKTKPIVNWCLDEPLGKYSEVNNVLARDEYTKFFVFDPYYVDKVKNGHYLPCGVDPEIHKPIQPDSDKVYDVTFIGSHSEDREKLLAELSKDFKINIWGYRWNTSSLKHLVRGEPLWADKQCNIYNLSKINLNPHFKHSIEGYNLRTFEIPASKSFQITDHFKESKNLFTSKELVTYKNIKELKELIEYYLEHSDERNKIATASYNKTLQQHTIRHRVQELIRVVKNESVLSHKERR